MVPVKTEYDIEAGHKERKIALLADLHNEKGEKVLEILKKEAPDLILIAGDMVDGNHVDWSGYTLINKNVTDFLTECARMAPTYYSMGNHEWFLRRNEFDRVALTGAIVLDNSYARLDEDLVVGGLTSATVMTRRAWEKDHPDWSWQNISFHRIGNLKKKPKEDQNTYLNETLDTSWIEAYEAEKGTKILLCHHPEYWALKGPILKERDINLTLSGHAHGGQWRIFGKSIFAPGQGIFPKYAGGKYEEEGKQLIVSRGLSNTVKVPRLWNPPEVVIINLH